MHSRALAYFCLLLVSFTLANYNVASASKLSLTTPTVGEITISVDPALHQQFGLAYPVTYKLSIPAGSSSFLVTTKHREADPWSPLPEKTSFDYFNGEEVVRFDYAANAAYVSVAFNDISDDIFLKVTDQTGQPVSIQFQNICRYYDNRQAVVTITADDWKELTNLEFLQAIRTARYFRLPITTAIITGGCTANTWQTIQAELDSGLVEAASHTRSHNSAPYDDPVSEIIGSKEDILANLTLPSQYRNGSQGYVYTFVAPYGVTTSETEVVVGQARYLINRLTNTSTGNFTPWDLSMSKYLPDGKTLETGLLYGGLSDVAVLNSRFDAALAGGTIYHVLMHPHDLAATDEWSKGYIQSHFSYISNRTNVWYVNFGPLYLYHLLQDDAPGMMASVSGAPLITTQPENVTVQQGQTATFTVIASGAAPLSYQWQRNDVDIPGATGAMYTTPNLFQPDSGTTFRCVVSDAEGTEISNSATALVLPPVINDLTNGGFEAGNTSGWTFYSNGTASVSPVPGGNGSATAARIAIVAEGTNVQFYQANVTLQPNTEYKLTFDAYSNTGHDLQVNLSKHVSPYTNYGLSGQAFDLTTGWQSFSVIFTTTGFSGTASDARLWFWLAPFDATGDAYYFDNVLLARVSDLTPAVVSPQITVPPTSQTVTVGQTATFSVVASGTAPLSYQWQKNSLDIAGATSFSYTTPATSVADSGALYRCKVSNAAGPVISTDAQLTVITPRPALVTADPRDTTVQEGRPANFTVSAIGDAPLTYQWQKNGTDIPGALSPSLSVTRTSRSDSGSGFRCVVSNVVGKDTSASAVLKVLPIPPAIIAQPTAQTVNVGQMATFTVRAAGTLPLTYQWQRNGADIGGATDTMCTTAATSAADSGALFRCIVSNVAGSDTSTQARLTVITPYPVVVLTNPRDTTVTEGRTAIFALTAAGTAPITYRWQKNGVDISGAAASSYTVSAPALADSGAAIRCIVSNSVGKDTSSTAILRVLPIPPTITTQPGSQTVLVGYSATFSVAATGSAPLSYQWQKDGSPIAGATGSNYTTPGTTSADNGVTFRCVVSNRGGSATSQDAVLTVNSAPPVIPSAVANGTFDGGATGWSFYSNGAASSSTISPGSSGTGQALQIAVATEGTNVQLFQTGITLQANTGYQLSFDAYSSTGHDLEVSLSQHVSPYTNYGLAGRKFDLTSSWQSFSITFTTAGFSGSVSDGRLWFWLAPYDANGDKYYFDNIQLSKTSDLAPLPPTITLQPVTQTVTAGQTATFSVSASGTAPLTYQWQRNTIDIAGATGSTYTTPAVTSVDSDSYYRCRVMNKVSSAYSGNAQLLVIAPQPPVVIANPRDTTVQDGVSARFTITAAGTPSLTYQWQKNGTDVAGATTASLAIAAAARADSGATFRCIVSNGAGKDTSTAARLSVLTVPPSIVTQPTNQTVSSGGTATFTVGAAGTLPLVYQWQRNGLPIVGAAATSYTTPAAVVSDSGSIFRCIVTNSAGSAISQAALLVVTTAPPVIPSAVSNGTFENGTAGWSFYSNGAATYASSSPGSSGSGKALQVIVTTEGTNVQLFQYGITLQANTSYQLSFDAYSSTGHDVDLSLQQHVSPYTNYGLTSRKFDLSGSWQTFTVAFTTSGFPGTVSDARLMLWLAPYDAAGDRYYFDNIKLAKTSDLTPTVPVITTQPVAQTVAAGQTATFSVIAAGTAPIIYQWQRNGTDVTGATNAAYTTPAVTAADSGALYRCRVTNTAGSVISSEVPLRVGAGPLIAIWYGGNQTFGKLGTPQRWINVFGNVSDAAGISSLSYNLNGGSAVALSRGPDQRRLALPGDFNIDISYSSLAVGANSLTVTARNTLNLESTQTITLTRAPGTVWPLPYNLNWNNSSSLTDSAQVVDGKWAIVPEGVRILERSYDRLIAIGDTTWTDYEVTTRVTITGFDSSSAAFGSISGGPGVGLLMRWKGHTTNPIAGQPLAGYLPLGCIGWMHWIRPDSSQWELVGNNLALKASAPSANPGLMPGVPYFFKMQVKTQSGQGIYKFKVWKTSESEPVDWLLSGSGALSDPSSGSFLLLAHHVSATFGVTTVTPIIPDAPASIVSDNFNNGSLNASLWTVTNPQSDVVVTQTGGRLSMAIPAGVSHDLWTGALLAPRVLQSAPNTDFGIEAKFDATLSAQYQFQGIVVQQDNANLLRFDFVRDNAGLRIFSASFAGGTATVRKDASIPSGSPLYLRVMRQGDNWTQLYSYDAVTWITAVTFTYPLTVTSVGPFAGTHGIPVTSSPAFTARVDYFSNTASPAMQMLTSAGSSGLLTEELPHEYSLEGNFPNPFNPSTVIRYALPEPAVVSIVVYSILGQEVARLKEGYQSAGSYQVSWEGRSSAGGSLSSGVYLCRMVATSSGPGKSFVATKRMVLLK